MISKLIRIKKCNNNYSNNKKLLLIPKLKDFYKVSLWIKNNKKMILIKKNYQMIKLLKKT